MPQLPKKNNLDYNPDATILASKKIRAIALENMKNPVLDPDQKTLSTLEAEKRLDETFNTLQELAGNYNSAILRLANTLATPARQGRGRLKGGADRDTSVASSVSTSPSLREYEERLRRDRSRFSAFYSDDARNTFAVPSATRGVIDDDTMSELPEGGDFVIPYTPIDTGRRTESRSFPELMFVIIQLVRKMDILLSSRIRPAINKLSQVQIDLLTKIYQMVENSKEEIQNPLTRSGTDPYTGVARRRVNPPQLSLPLEMSVFGQYGDEIFETFKVEVNKLLLNLTVIINSWKQNTPLGQQTEVVRQVEGAGRKPRGRPKKDTMKMTLVGSGRNFYGETINNSRDIPTIWQVYRDCPTKYLL
jgi:hypothetical protein